MLDTLLRPGVGARGLPFGNLIVLDEIDSTNDLARRLLDRLWVEGSDCPEMAFVAGRQTAGRGRQGRTWVSEPRVGAYITVVQPIAREGDLQTLPLLVGVAVAGALRELGCEARLKWPNDVLVGGRKIGGILIETSSRGPGGSAAIVGFGVNHGQDEANLPTETATSLVLELSDPVPLEDLISGLLEAASRELAHLGQQDYARRRYVELSAHEVGRRLRCRLGGETLEGIFLGFDRRGFLRLEIDSHERILTAGEVLE